MPRQTNVSVIPYDVEGWLKRNGVTQAQAAESLGVSASLLWRAAKAKQASKQLAWALYGLERNIHDQRTGKVPG